MDGFDLRDFAHGNERQKLEEALISCRARRREAKCARIRLRRIPPFGRGTSCRDSQSESAPELLGNDALREIKASSEDR